MLKKKLGLFLWIALLVAGCERKMNYEPVIDNPDNETITLAFAGDVMLGRWVNDRVIAGNKAPGYVWGNMIGLLKNADLSVVNLESVIARSGKKWSKTPKVFFFRADPKAIDVLKVAGIDFVALANNHVLDYREEALIETLRHLENNGIAYAGAGRNIMEASRAARFEVKGVKVAILGLTDNVPGWMATETRPGVNYVEISTDDDGFSKVEKIIRDAKNNADVVIVSAHWGPNMRQRPTKNFKEFARAVIDAGADIFHGHSAHIFQGIEIYEGKLIMYDTGDFVDDYAVNSVLRNDQTFLFSVTASKNKIRKIELFPGLIRHMQVNRAKGGNFEKIAEKMIKLSDEMGVEIVKKEDRLEVALN